MFTVYYEDGIDEWFLNGNSSTIATFDDERDAQVVANILNVYIEFVEGNALKALTKEDIEHLLHM